ncbi:hypothetical protein Ahia01_000852400 [Argonauta hians]
MWSIRITLLLVALCVCESVSLGRKKKAILESDNPSDLVEALRVIDRERRRLGLDDKESVLPEGGIQEEPILADSQVNNNNNNNNYDEDYGVAREVLDDADDDADVQVETRDYVPEDELSGSRGRVDIPLAEHLSLYKKKRDVPLIRKNRRYFKGTKNKRRPISLDQAASKVYGNERNGGEDSNNDYKKKLNYMTSYLDDPIEAAVNKLSTKDIHKLISLIKFMENEKKRILAEQEREYENIAEQPSKGEMRSRETSSVADEESTENYYPQQQQQQHKPEPYSDVNLLNQNKKTNAINKELEALYRKAEKRARNLDKVRQSYQKEKENEESQPEIEEETEEPEPEFSESTQSDITPFDFSKAQLNIGNPDVAKVIALLWINYKLEGMEINYLTDAIHAATASQSQSSSSSSFESIPAEIGNLKKAMNVEKVMKDFGIKNMDSKSSEALDLLALSYLKRYAHLPKNMIDLIDSKLTEVAQEITNYNKRGDYFNEEVSNPKTTKRYNTKPLKYQTSGNQRQDIRQYIPSDVKELTVEDFQRPGISLSDNSYGNKDNYGRYEEYDNNDDDVDDDGDGDGDGDGDDVDVDVDEYGEQPEEENNYEDFNRENEAYDNDDDDNDNDDDDNNNDDDGDSDGEEDEDIARFEDAQSLKEEQGQAELEALQAEGRRQREAALNFRLMLAELDQEKKLRDRLLKEQQEEEEEEEEEAAAEAAEAEAEAEAEEEEMRMEEAEQECPLISMAGNCQFADMLKIPFTSVSRDLCNRHAVCYNCGSSLEMGPNSCDRGFLGESIKYCDNNVQCIREASSFLSLMKAAHSYNTIPNRLCERSCVRDYVIGL